MGTPFVAGRDFDERDNLKAPRVAIVNEMFAKTFFSGQNPVGRAFRQEGGAGRPDDFYQIVGLARNTKYYELREDFRPIAFLPSAQDDNPLASGSFVLRTSKPLGEFFKTATASVAQVQAGATVDFTVLTAELIFRRSKT